MKKLIAYFVTGLLLISSAAQARQNGQPEVPGDNFSLEGALELFKKSASPEEFERLLNSESSNVNNLDLNGDGLIDYVKVVAHQDRNVHIFVLQAVISKDERQDVAVIELEKLEDGKAVLQIVGDADIYGIETIIEPTTEVRVNAGTTTSHTVVNVWAWPSVQYIYGPYYAGWVSPWAWSYYPRWWSPWRPIAYVSFSPYWYSYRPYYRICHTPRIVYAHRMYRPMRTTSVVVYNRHQREITRYRSASYESRNRSGYVTTRSTRGYDAGRHPSRDRSQVATSRSSSHDRRLSSTSRPATERTTAPERATTRTRERSTGNNERAARPSIGERENSRKREDIQRRPSVENRERTPSREYSAPKRSSEPRQPSVQQRSTPERRSVSPGGSNRSSAPKSGGGNSRSRGRD